MSGESSVAGQSSFHRREAGGDGLEGTVRGLWGVSCEKALVLKVHNLHNDGRGFCGARHYAARTCVAKSLGEFFLTMHA